MTFEKCISNAVIPKHRAQHLCMPKEQPSASTRYALHDFMFWLACCCSTLRALRPKETPSASRALMALWCHMRLCARRETSTLLSLALWVARPLMMGSLMRPPCTGPAPQSRVGPGRAPHQAGRLSQTAPLMQASSSTMHVSCVGATSPEYLTPLDVPTQHA